MAQVPVIILQLAPYTAIRLQNSSIQPMRLAWQEAFRASASIIILDQFAARFPTEESCTDYFRSVRERVGVTCAHCKGKRHSSPYNIYKTGAVGKGSPASVASRLCPVMVDDEAARRDGVFYPYTEKYYT